MSEFFQKNSEDKGNAAKSYLKRFGKRRKKMNIARSRGFPLHQILHYNPTRDYLLFDEVGLRQLLTNYNQEIRESLLIRHCLCKHFWLESWIYDICRF